eukprot:m.1188463 g.1188463  ORF g.1188463 m.1188463 type:complete len:74 (+) comp24553_c0_seq13:3626-3847(+)
MGDDHGSPGSIKHLSWEHHLSAVSTVYYVPFTLTNTADISCTVALLQPLRMTRDEELGTMLRTAVCREDRTQS